MDRQAKIDFIKRNIQYCSDQDLDEIDSIYVQGLPVLARFLNKLITRTSTRQGLLGNMRRSLDVAPDVIIDQILALVQKTVGD